MSKRLVMASSFAGRSRNCLRRGCVVQAADRRPHRHDGALLGRRAWLRRCSASRVSKTAAHRFPCRDACASAGAGSVHVGV